MKLSQLLPGDTVRYFGPAPHWLVGKTGTVQAAFGDGGYEVLFGREKALWFAASSNLSLLRRAKQ